jgi:hypothetical protein
MLVLTIASVSNAQNVNIPDTAFLNALIEEGVDTNEDNLISFEEAEAVNSLYISGEFYCEMASCVTLGNISELTGIEAFINLDSLFIRGNHIDSIDLSMNKDLYYLDCCYNNLTSLDLSKNTALTELYCNNSQLPGLDVSNNTALSRLECDHNQLTSLDVSNNTALTNLSCISNQLTSLDVSNNIALKYLSCRAYGFELGQLTSLDISGCTALEYLDCFRNQLTSLDVSNNTELVYLDLSSMPTLYEVCVWESFPAGVDVDTSGSPNVYFATDCVTNIPGEYKDNSRMDIYPNPATQELSIDLNETTGENTSIILFDITGRLVYSEILNYTTPSIHTINLSFLRKGHYLIQISNEQYSYTEKLIIME